MSEAAFSPRWHNDGFTRDRRFAPVAHISGQSEPEQPKPQGDPVETARIEGFDEGYRRGFDDACAQAQAAADAERAATAAIELSIRKLDTDMAEQLREQLRVTVELLCESAVLPLALDPVGLASRVDRALAMFQRADDERVLCLHPDDLDLLRDRLPPALELRGDAAMERGSIRVETPQGGLEDGPAQWRDALAVALGQC